MKTTPRTRMAIVCLALAALLAGLTGCLAMINSLAVKEYNQATSSLQTNLKQADRPDADLTGLRAAQEQTDAQFDQVDRFKTLLLPSTRTALERNRDLSRKLSALLEREEARQERSDTGGSETHGKDGNGTGTGRGGQADGGKGEHGRSQEEKQKLEDLLSQNSQGEQGKSGGESKDSGGRQVDRTVKPW